MAAAADDDIEPAEIKSAGKSRNKGKKASDVDEEEYVELEATPPAKTKGKKGKAANSADEAEEPKRSGRKKNVVYEDDDADDLDEALKKQAKQRGHPKKAAMKEMAVAAEPKKQGKRKRGMVEVAVDEDDDTIQVATAVPRKKKLKRQHAREHVLLGGDQWKIEHYCILSNTANRLPCRSGLLSWDKSVVS
ncbi:hypothetical protein LTR36_010255 [Oleoguttula mirabilis]|uniref:Uncharacterized protein n=1 Tax=Oleoguttula mirabilis TaxID=1507867 RepID=A0AAV9JUY6_9PEZI|nr:hypothetical protein LTR36_010255 [Oleoguttula mirabilis]